MARQIGGVRAQLEFGPVALLCAGLGVLPLGRAVRAAARLGEIAMALDRIDRPVAMRNLEIAFPDLSVARRLTILRATYRNWGRMMAEWTHFDELTTDNVSQFVTYEGREHWDDAIRRAQGRGILTLTGHFGNFELLVVGHSAYGNPIAMVHRALRNPLMDAAVIRARTRFGAVMVTRKGGARPVLKLLRENFMVAIPLDLDVRKGVFVDFFSLKAATSDALARLAMATGAPVLPAFMVRDGDSTRHRITCLPIIETVKTRDREESARENTQRYTAAIETMVRRYPDHWNWIHRRWKTRPPREPRFY
ncbi:MAG: lysophospholipid acyltransferase family protein [Candidatus Binataceae bacterium]